MYNNINNATGYLTVTAQRTATALWDAGYDISAIAVKLDVDAELIVECCMQG